MGARMTAAEVKRLLEKAEAVLTSKAGGLELLDFHVSAHPNAIRALAQSWLRMEAALSAVMECQGDELCETCRQLAREALPKEGV
jgi:hypothetical protein